MNEWLALLQASVAQRRIRMEVVYLLCSAISTFLTSSLLSLALAIRSIPLCFSCLRFHCDRNAAVLLYEGRVRHARRRPVKHAFEYSVRYALIDLDGAPHPSHLSAERAREIARTNGPVFLLTIPESVGYEQNPLSVYYCYDVEEGKGEEGDGPKPSLKMCIAEVTNTPWGERVSFTFSPGSDVAAKPLHVSPFMDMQGNWHMFADAPGEDLSLVISVQHPTLGNYFTASLHAKRVQSSSSSIFLEKFFWLMPHKVAVWIYWQAFKLWWKNTKFLDHPKYASSRYKDDAARRNRELHSGNSRQGEDLPNCSVNMFPRDRWCEWREAPWPWS
ncbi:uncharacterized protein LOC122038770 [Zingiber officinale]|uniref:uncharacterized protein LOC122038770 n=1 Tax=Zingiber officinale TaxID=94328 RepID=UPI001C4C096F|nr:uncharacterized protein LOC122038770 [Zingiber officinale]